MGDRQKQIEEMAYSICTANRKLIKSCRECPIFQGYKYPCVKKEFAEKFYNAGCRMQSDTAREVIIKLLSIIQNEYEYYPDGITLGAYAQLRKEINELSAEYNVEV